MFNMKCIILFFVFQIVKPSQISFESKDMFYRTHDRILEIIDNVFISLKIDENFKKSKNVAEYFSMHNYIQDAVEKNEQVYQNVRSTFKTNLSNKTAHSILNVNEVIDETISKQQNIIFKQLLKNNSKIRAITNNDILKDFMALARDFHLKINISVANDIKSLASDLKNIYSKSRKLLQGTGFTIKKFPFIVSIHVRDYFTCAGSLIREDLVISAASCLIQFVSEDSDVTSLSVRGCSDYTDKNGELIPIADLIFYSDFNPSNLNHNLVIIRLTKQLQLGKRALVKYDTIADDLPENMEEVFILGWGEMTTNQHGYIQDKVDQKLSYASLEIYDFMNCVNHFTRFYISDQQFCAGIYNESRGACKNDIGGPAVVGDTLVGVISFSSPHCGQPGVPTVFTKIGFYAKWITSVFEAFPLHKQMETKIDPSTYEDDSQAGKEDKLKVAQKEESLTRANPGLDSNLKQTSGKHYLHNGVKNDTFKQTTKQDALPHPPQAIFPKPDLVATMRLFTKEQTNPTLSPFKKLSKPPLAAHKTIDKLDWNYVDNIFDRLLEVAKNSETSNLTTLRENITPVYSVKPTKITYGDDIHMTSSSLNTDGTTTNTPFTQNTEEYYYSEENYEDNTQSEFEHDLDISNANGDLAYEEDGESKVEVVIKEFGTTKRFLLDKKKANVRENLMIIKEKLSNHDSDMTMDWLTMVSHDKDVTSLHSD